MAANLFLKYITGLKDVEVDIGRLPNYWRLHDDLRLSWYLQDIQTVITSEKNGACLRTLLNEC
ncbi:hypothetical protein DPMN_114182 [Dreissena polymorpha]|uniref:Uncharacterized protein n=1 Tax=Dreissena polymorpha TaxID=45954 RepID=A0A9D4KJE6_DREPO|nr:hypothetical protein DPMN_114182 [Dreissena polymorpha]